MPEIGSKTTFWSPMTIGFGKTALQFAGLRFVVNCKANPAAFDGHVKTTLAPYGTMVSRGANERLNTVPKPELPPYTVVPYKVPPAKIKLASVSSHRCGRQTACHHPKNQVEQTLGNMDEMHRAGPAVPKLKPRAPRFDVLAFCR
jgi:hypothetical protein